MEMRVGFAEGRCSLGLRGDIRGLCRGLMGGHKGLHRRMGSSWQVISGVCRFKNVLPTKSQARNRAAKRPLCV